MAWDSPTNVCQKCFSPQEKEVQQGSQQKLIDINMANSTERALVVSFARTYLNVLRDKPASYTDIESFAIGWKSPEDYELVARIGRGKFSEVFEAKNVALEDMKCVLKVLKPIRKEKIKKEMRILRNLQDSPHVVKLLALVIDHSDLRYSLVFEYVNSPEIKGFFKTLDEPLIKYYTLELLKGIDYCHSHGIMHRDLKPQNLLVNETHRTLRIIDFGLSDFYRPGEQHSCRVASKHYKAPELLLEYPYYDYSVDMWAFGCILASIIFDIDTFFALPLEVDQLDRVTAFLGVRGLVEYMNDYNIPYKMKPGGQIFAGRDLCVKSHHLRKDYNMYINEVNKNKVHAVVIDFLENLLVYNHQYRLTASEAMSHPYYFDIIKEAEEHIASDSKRAQKHKKPSKTNKSKGKRSQDVEESNGRHK